MLPKFPLPKLSDVLSRPDAHLTLDSKGTILPQGKHIAQNPQYRVKGKDGKWQWLPSAVPASHTSTIKRTGTPQGASQIASVIPTPITPGEPSDIGPVKDLGSNIIFTNPDSVQDVQQWSIADCYYLAPIGSLLYCAGWYIKQLVSKNDKGGFDVQFRRNGTLSIVTVDSLLGSPPITCGVNPVTQAIGVVVFEKAYAYFRTGANTYASLNWGASSAAFNDLGCQSVYLNATTTSVITPCLANLAKSYPLVAQTVATIPNNLPLIESHVYMLLNVAQDANGVWWFTLANPWGIDGFNDDSNPNDGVVTLSFAQFAQGFSLVNALTSFALDVPTTPPIIAPTPTPLPTPVPTPTPTPAPTPSGTTIYYSSKILPGDANSDGIVDIQDQTITSNYWQQQVASGTNGDVNFDGVVNIQDLTIEANHWQQTVSGVI